MTSLQQIRDQVCACTACPRLVAWRQQAARQRPVRYAQDDYWARPVPGFGDAKARLLIVGLAPAAHGANRTGRMFTGDRSGDWLYRALHKAGYASQPMSVSAADGLRLMDAYVSAVVRCAPPANKPSVTERDTCIGYLQAEMRLLRNVRVIVALGSFAWDGTLRAARGIGVAPSGRKPRFGHLASAPLGAWTLLGSYHPSQQNTFTGTLTQPMFDAVFAKARELTGL